MIANQSIWHRKDMASYWSNFYAQDELVNGAIQRSFSKKVKRLRLNFRSELRREGAYDV